MKKEILLFGSSTPRSGGSLVSNILSVHKDIIITQDLIHFFRHIYKKYLPLHTAQNKFLLVEEMCLRIKTRNNIILNSKQILKNIKNVKNYAQLVKKIFSYILEKNNKKKIIGETANGEWRNIGVFLNLDNNNKCYQVIRDPRAILVSWKKISFSKNYDYLNILFNWIDSINFSKEYLRKYKSRYMRLKFEEIHSDPKKNIHKICKFANVELDKNMLKPEKWPSLLQNKFNHINVSVYNKKNIYGFSKKRSTNWKYHIKDWELTLIQFLFKNQLKQLGYKIYKDDKKLLAKGLKILESSSLLNKNYKFYKKNGKGTDKRLNDPSNPKNWGVIPNMNAKKQNLQARFIDTADYKIFAKKMKEIKRNSKKFFYD